MTEKELRHLGKTDMLRLLRDQEAELLRLRAETERLQKQLEDRQIRLDRCGSIAEASLELGGVFAAAQAAADQYVNSVKAANERAEEMARGIEAEARRHSDAMLQETEEACRMREEESCRRAEAYWTGLQSRLEAFYESHQGLRNMLADAGLEVNLTQARQEDRT